MSATGHRAPMLLVITDEEQCRAQARGVLETVARIVEAAPSPRLGVLLRDKATSKNSLLERARALRTLCRGAGVKVLIHTHVDLALEADLDGVHLDGVSNVAEARAALGPERLLGASRHRGDALDGAHTEGLDYVTLSPVFAPTSKPHDGREPLGLEGLAAAVETSAVPVLGLGGMSVLQAPGVLRAGAAGLAVLGGVMGAHAPELVTRDLLHALERAA